ncbi:hypothetical protein DFH09DRAFT_1077420 [Mycena vulgaris]|nr:hypothetical protein DFH09DRAFT_1077420 [Mycena vulgaris]
MRKLRVSAPSDPGVRAAKMRGNAGGIKAWSARGNWVHGGNCELARRRKRRERREKRREAGALESDDTMLAEILNNVYTSLEGHITGTAPRTDSRNGGTRQKAESRGCGGRSELGAAGLLVAGARKGGRKAGALKRVEEAEQRIYTSNDGLHKDTGTGRFNCRHPAGTGARKERASGDGSGGTKTGNAAREEEKGAQRSHPTFAVLWYKLSCKYRRERWSRGTARTSTV